jgi:hypothetical protein
MAAHHLANSAVPHEIKPCRPKLLRRSIAHEELNFILIEKLKPAETPEDHVQS